MALYKITITFNMDAGEGAIPRITVNCTEGPASPSTIVHNINQLWTRDRKECAIYIAYIYIYIYSVYIYIYIACIYIYRCQRLCLCIWLCWTVWDGIMWGSCGDWFGISLRHSRWMLYELDYCMRRPRVDCDPVLCRSAIALCVKLSECYWTGFVYHITFICEVNSHILFETYLSMHVVIKRWS